MNSYKITTNRGECFCKVENMRIVEADKDLQKFIGESLMTLINVCAIKMYSIEKL